MKTKKKLLSHLPINPFTHLLFVLCTLSFVLVQNCNTTEPGDDNKNTPPDTTTQDFTFETYEFGDGFNSSYFNDVWIFDENNIWAVGDISLESGFTNIMRWDGTKWFSQKPYFTSSGFSGIWAIDSTTIFFADGAVVIYENGKYSQINFGNLGLTNGQAVQKLWGSNENNIYGVGPNGTIVHFDGKTWTKIDFETQWRFDDITGNTKTGTAYAVATGDGFATAIIELNNTSTNIIYNEKSLTSYSIKMLNESELILSDSKIWKFNLNSNKAGIFDDLKPGYFLPLSSMAASNDLYFFGNKLSNGEKMIHYNGMRFTVFDMPNRDDVIYGGAFAINDLAIMTGLSHNKAYLVKIVRR